MKSKKRKSKTKKKKLKPREKEKEKEEETVFGQQLNRIKYYKHYELNEHL
jgi:hypothetical protein